MLKSLILGAILGGLTAFLCSFISSLARKAVALFSKRRRSYRRHRLARAGIRQLSSSYWTPVGRHERRAKENR
jgi:hypothetical protein